MILLRDFKEINTFEIILIAKNIHCFVRHFQKAYIKEDNMEEPLENQLLKLF